MSKELDTRIQNLLAHGDGYFHEDEAIFNENGFSGMLRPWKGLLNNNFHEVVELFLVTHSSILGDKINRQMLTSLLRMCNYARSICISLNSSLRKNRLINDKEISLLESWLNVIDNLIIIGLEKQSLQDLVLVYCNYINKTNEKIEYDLTYLLPLLTGILTSNKSNDNKVTALISLRKINIKSEEVLNALEQVSLNRDEEVQEELSKTMNVLGSEA